MMPFSLIVAGAMILSACGAGGKRSEADTASLPSAGATAPGAAAFSADSAYAYVARQVEFGPRVPNSDAHRAAGDWIAATLRRHGAEVIEQRPTLRAFDGTMLRARNIFGSYNPDARQRILLLAHWDCRPWADEDPDPANHTRPVDGANDGASGVGVILEIARQLGAEAPQKGVDILFVDAEDWGTAGNDDSWALGAQYFTANPPVEGYAPAEAILLDMVGGKDAKFRREYFSEQAAPELSDRLWQTAANIGHGARFINRMGTAVTDDHVKLIEVGIPAVDIIEYYDGAEGPFNPHWHKSTDNMDAISAETLGAVGETVMTYLRDNY